MILNIVKFYLRQISNLQNNNNNKINIHEQENIPKMIWLLTIFVNCNLVKGRVFSSLRATYIENGTKATHRNP